ncbi:MAG: DEAD/DEAH box helicase, partial [Flavobacteriales bacterium]|nr:DEAD/DEAH box helicase [Flavobacteriales bacterium]
MPAYSYDPYMYRLHKMNGGTFSSYTDKSYRPFTDEQLLKHLTGEQFIGIYPLLQDNTSWFIIADFDKDKWQEECKSFLSVCNLYKIPAYLERSRSGNGGHVWIFFEQAYPAIKSRRLFKSLLEQCGAFSVFDKASSFDRLFPNQDFLSGKGLGNLIALPLFKDTLEQGNNCFIDTETLVPFDNQWDFLKQIKRISSADLDNLYDSIHKDEETLPYPASTNGKLIISLNNSVRINRLGLTLPLINFLKTEFNLPNSEYFIKKKTKRSTWDTKRYFNLIEENENEVILPSGAIGKVLRFCSTQKIDFEFDDQRKKAKPIPFVNDLNLRKHQHTAIETSSKKDFGVIVAPPGSGKTIMALKIIAKKQQPALIIVHRKQLLEQWVERIESFLKIPKNEIGKIGQGKTKVGKHITVAMIQSLGKKIVDEKLTDAFKTIIIDECHHIPAESYSSTISKLHPYYQYGLTATPFRKYDDGKLIFAHLGEVIAEIKPQDIETYKRARIVIRNTNFSIPFNSKTDQFETLSKVLIHDSARNKLIIDDVSAEINKGIKAVVITERKEHIEALNQFLKQSYEVITFSGDDSESSRKLKWKALNEGNYQVLITTGQFFGEGTDLQNSNCLFLVYPSSFKGKLIQYIGRVQRSEVTPV